MMAINVLCSAVPPELVSALTDKKMAKKAYEAIMKMRVRNDRVKNSAHSAALVEVRLGDVQRR
jgi:hypothetical protein